MIQWLGKAETLELVIWSIFIGVSIGVFAVFYTRRILGAFIRKLLEKNCTSPENALSIEELGFASNFFVKSSLKSGILKLFVLTDKNCPPSDLKTDKLYIPESKKHGAELRFSGKDTDVFGIIIALAIFVALAYAMTLIIPYVMTLIGDIEQ